MINKYFFFLVLIFTSCSSIQFKSSEIIPVHFNKDITDTENVDVEVEKSFYLWGMLPSSHSVEVDKLFEQRGADSVSNFSIAEIKTQKKTLWMILSAGLYYPQTYLVSGNINR